MIDLYFLANTREALIDLGKAYDLLVEVEDPETQEMVLTMGEGAVVDPWIDGPEWHTGIAILDPTGEVDEEGNPTYALKLGYHVNVMIEGAREAAQTDGLPQVDESGEPLPVRERTHFGRLFEEHGEPFEDGRLKGRTLEGVTLLYEDSIRTLRRVRQ